MSSLWSAIHTDELQGECRDASIERIGFRKRLERYACQERHVRVNAHTYGANGLAGEPAEKFLLVHAVLKSLTAIDKYDRNLIVKLTPEFVVGVDVNLLPGEASTARKFAEALLHHLTQMTPFAGIDDHSASFWHAERILTWGIRDFPQETEVGWYDHCVVSMASEPVESMNARSESETVAGQDRACDRRRQAFGTCDGSRPCRSRR